MRKAGLIILTMLWVSSFVFGQTSQTFTFTVEGMTCNNCAQSLTETLQKMEGVESASVDFSTKTAKVIATGDVTIQKLKTVVQGRNFEALFKGEFLPPPLTADEKKGLDILVIKGGGKINIKDYLTEGKITIFDFYADWCGPCRVFSPKLERLIRDNNNVTLRKVDIVTWKSALSKQLTKTYKMPALPFVLVFDDHGKLLGKVEGNYIEQVESLVKSNRD